MVKSRCVEILEDEDGEHLEESKSLEEDATGVVVFDDVWEGFGYFCISELFDFIELGGIAIL